MRDITIDVGEHGTVSGALVAPDAPTAALVLAHGAGAGMNHAFMRDVADGLAVRGIATLRYQFPYMERGSKRTDAPPVAHAAVRAAVEASLQAWPGLPLFAGGKSFGGRMTSQAQAGEPLPDVKGLVFLGFPLHPADKPSIARADHLARVAVPMLFLQGTRDKLADLAAITGVVASLGPRATMKTFDDADHSFHVRVSSGSTDALVLAAMLDVASAWMTSQ